MAPRYTTGAAYVKAKLQESDHMGKVEASAAALLSECSAVLIRKLIAATPPPLSVSNLQSTIEKDDTFQCLRSALDDFQPVKLSASFLSAHLKQQGRVAGAAVQKKKRSAAAGAAGVASKRKKPPSSCKSGGGSSSSSSSKKAATAATAASPPIIVVKAMEDVEEDFVARIEEETSTGHRFAGHGVIEDEEDYD
jgi:hypothetical protein